MVENCDVTRLIQVSEEREIQQSQLIFFLSENTQVLTEHLSTAIASAVSHDRSTLITAGRDRVVNVFRRVAASGKSSKSPVETTWQHTQTLPLFVPCEQMLYIRASNAEDRCLHQSIIDRISLADGVTRHRIPPELLVIGGESDELAVIGLASGAVTHIGSLMLLPRATHPPRTLQYQGSQDPVRSDCHRLLRCGNELVIVTTDQHMCSLIFFSLGEFFFPRFPHVQFFSSLVLGIFGFDSRVSNSARMSADVATVAASDYCA